MVWVCVLKARLSWQKSQKSNKDKHVQLPPPSAFLNVFLGFWRPCPLPTLCETLLVYFLYRFIPFFCHPAVSSFYFIETTTFYSLLQDMPSLWASALATSAICVKFCSSCLLTCLLGSLRSMVSHHFEHWSPCIKQLGEQYPQPSLLFRNLISASANENIITLSSRWNKYRKRYGCTILCLPSL